MKSDGAGGCSTGTASATNNSQEGRGREATGTRDDARGRNVTGPATIAPGPDDSEDQKICRTTDNLHTLSTWLPRLTYRKCAT